MKKIFFLIIGAGDASNEIKDLIKSNFKNLVVKKTKKNKVNIKKFDNFIIAIGDPDKREKIFFKIKKNASKLLSIIDKSAYISSFSSIGKGTIVSPNVTIGYNVKIGRNCFIGANCSIGHDVIIGDHCVISPGSLIGGGARIGKSTLLSLGSKILPYLKIGNNSKISAGEVVFKNLPSRCTFIKSRILKK